MWENLIWKNLSAPNTSVKDQGKAKADPRPSRLLLSCFPQYTFCLPHNIAIFFQMASFVLHYTYSSTNSMAHINLPQNLHQVCLPVSTASARNKQMASFLVAKT